MKNKIKNHGHNFSLKIIAIIFLIMALLIFNPLFISGCKLNYGLKKDVSNNDKEPNGIIRVLQYIAIINKSSGNGALKIISIKQSIKHFLNYWVKIDFLIIFDFI
jgi:hypothetical protein